MFTTHFRLNAQPFAEHTPVDRLWIDERMAQGLARLRYLADQATLGLLTGATGIGKSALVKRFLHEMRGPGYETRYVHWAQLSAMGLLQQLVATLGETPQWHKQQLLSQLVEHGRTTEGTLLIVLDEAHLLATETLIDLRLLVSSATDQRPPLKLLLVGQDSLIEVLRRTLHRDLLDRITVRYHIHPLDKPQTAAYIDFQIRSAGGADKLFTQQVKELIHDYTGGVPRQINNLATACLLLADATAANRIDESILQQTLAEFHLP